MGKVELVNGETDVKEAEPRKCGSCGAEGNGKDLTLVSLSLKNGVSIEYNAFGECQSLKKEERPTLSRKFHISNIEWDTDGEDVPLPEATEIEEADLLQVYGYEDPDEAFACIPDYLSDEFGWCVSGYAVLVEIPPEMLESIAYQWKEFDTKPGDEGFSIVDFMIDNGYIETGMNWTISS